MEIVKDNNFLRKRSKEVIKVNGKIRELALGMAEIMELNDGVGLAAPQVGRLERVIVIKSYQGFDCFINPIILKKSREKDVMEEGCLSLPQCLLKIKRAMKIRIKFLDLNGKEMVLDLSGLTARITQHEIDHLNGILITDRISLVQKIKNFFNSGK